MVEIWVPFGETELCVTIPPENYLGVLKPSYSPTPIEVDTAISEALENPVGTPKLSEVAKNGDKVAILLNRPRWNLPWRNILSSMVKTLSSSGIPLTDVKLIFGSGLERPLTESEVGKFLGTELADLAFVSHDPSQSGTVEVGATSYKTHVWLNKDFAEADVKIVVGPVDFDPIEGYVGGRDALLISTGSRTINHCLSFVNDPNCHSGNLDKNPIHMDLLEASKFVNVSFSLNVVSNRKGKVLRIVAGDLSGAFTECVKFLNQNVSVPFEREADIVAVGAGGSPADSIFYSCLESIERASNVVKDGGAIILLAECRLGHGNNEFYEWMNRFRTLEEVRDQLRRTPSLGGYAAFVLLRIMQKARIIGVTSMPDYMASGVFRMRVGRTATEAVESALRMIGRDSRVAVVYDGGAVFPYISPTSPQH